MNFLWNVIPLLTQLAYVSITNDIDNVFTVRRRWSQRIWFMALPFNQSSHLRQGLSVIVLWCINDGVWYQAPSSPSFVDGTVTASSRCSQMRQVGRKRASIWNPLLWKPLHLRLMVLVNVLRQQSRHDDHFPGGELLPIILVTQFLYNTRYVTQLKQWTERAWATCTIDHQSWWYVCESTSSRMSWSIMFFRLKGR